MPARIEPHQPRIAGEGEGPLGPAGREEAEHRGGAEPQARERGVDGEARALGGDRILEQHVEHRLLPDQLGLGWERRAGDPGQGGVEGQEGAIGGERHPGRDDPRLVQGAAILGEPHRARDPDPRGVGEQRPGSSQVEVARSPEREIEVPHRLERHPHHHPQHAPVRPEEGQHGHAGGDVVGRGRPGPGNPGPRSQGQRQRDPGCRPHRGESIIFPASSNRVPVFEGRGAG